MSEAKPLALVVDDEVQIRRLVGMTPDVIVPNTNLVTAILQEETQTIPIVFVFVGDPVRSGFVASLARPGGNLTGFALFEAAIGAADRGARVRVCPL
jgi:putative ABC transport system substrate-binding protein